VSEEPVEGHLSYFGCEIVLIGRKFIWHCWLILRFDFWKTLDEIPETKEGSQCDVS
jgi:hypothetical protein